ncbi:CPCC family cysteine-rich protein [Serratia sp. NPDC078593]
MCLCPCCHKYEFSEVGSYEICPVCNWEDNPIQGEDPTYGYGG